MFSSKKMHKISFFSNNFTVNKLHKIKNKDYRTARPTSFCSPDRLLYLRKRAADFKPSINHTLIIQMLCIPRERENIRVTRARIFKLLR
jgi:hypothetical protein